MNRKNKKISSSENEEILNFHNENPGNLILNSIRVELKCKNDRQKDLVNSIRDNAVTFCEGSPGTGKTYLSLLEGVKAIKIGKYKKIVLVKSVTTLEDESLGFLKGDLETKLTPIMYSFTGNLEKLIGKHLTEQLKIMGYIEWMPIAYLRGINIDDSFIIVDEAQNISIDSIRTILSRVSESSKIVLLGDSHQKDIKNKNNSALEFIITHFKDIPNVGIVRFEKEHIIRNPMIKYFEDKFDELTENGTIDLLRKPKKN